MRPLIISLEWSLNEVFECFADNEMWPESQHGWTSGSFSMLEIEERLWDLVSGRDFFKETATSLLNN